MQIDTNVSESDVGVIETARGFFTVEAYPKGRSRGQVTQLRPRADHGAERRDLRRRGERRQPRPLPLPGMTANTRIITDERKDVLRGAGDRAHRGNRAPAAANGAPGAGVGQAAEARSDARSGPRSAAGERGDRVAGWRPRRGRRRGEPGPHGRRQASPRGEAAGAARVHAAGGHARRWVLRDGRPEAVDVTTGLSDGSCTEITGGELQSPTTVIVNEIAAARRKNDAHDRALGAALPAAGGVALMADRQGGRGTSPRRHRGPRRRQDLSPRRHRGARAAGVSLTVERGEFVAIMGASGSGKSTLMNTLGCLDRPTSGQLPPGRRRRRARSTSRRSRTSGASASASCSRTSTCCRGRPPPRTSRCRSSTRAGREERRERVRDGARARSASPDASTNYPSQLSGGQQQRVAIARALINEPAILLADEPTGNLDSKTAEDIIGTIRRLNRERGLTVVLVTHEPDIAAFADRVVTMRDGAHRDRRAPGAPARRGVPPVAARADVPAPRDGAARARPSAARDRSRAWRSSPPAARSRATRCARPSRCSASSSGSRR